MLEIPHLLYLTPKHPSCLMVNYPFCIVYSLFLTSWCITPIFSMVNRRLTSHFGWVSAHPLSSETSSKGGSEEDETGKVSCGTCKNQRNSWENEGKWWYSRYSIGTVQLYKSAEIQKWLLVTLSKEPPPANSAMKVDGKLLVVSSVAILYPDWFGATLYTLGECGFNGLMETCWI